MIEQCNFTKHPVPVVAVEQAGQVETAYLLARLQVSFMFATYIGDLKVVGYRGGRATAR